MQTPLNIFFIIGAQRSGTSYLRQVLDEHPDIVMAKPFNPEPKFFLKEVNKEDKDSYLNRYFKPEELGDKILGEKSTSYLEFPQAAIGIKKIFPKAKILVGLRNPVYRAISNYFYTYNNGLETRTLEEVFINNDPAPVSSGTSVSPFDYVKRGEYAQYLKSYYDQFSKENIKVLLYEEMVGNLKTIQEIYTFLGADPSYVPTSLSIKINEGITQKEISVKVIEQLKQYYQPYNKALKDLYGINTHIWN